MDVVRSLFDPEVHVAEMDPGDADVSRLLPAEAALVSRAVDKRRREFAAGRTLARRLLRKLGVAEEFALLNGEDRAPIWPEGLVGSITHTRGWAAVAVARSADVVSLGCDVETDEPMQAELFRIVCTPAERERLAWLPEKERGLRAKIIFSAKEAVYKTQYPLTRTFLGFHGAEITLDHDIGRFRATLQTDVADRFTEGDVLEGRFVIDGGIVATAITLR